MTFDWPGCIALLALMVCRERLLLNPRQGNLTKINAAPQVTCDRVSEIYIPDIHIVEAASRSTPSAPYRLYVRRASRITASASRTVHLYTGRLNASTTPGRPQLILTYILNTHTALLLNYRPGGCVPNANSYIDINIIKNGGRLKGEGKTPRTSKNTKASDENLRDREKG